MLVLAGGLAAICVDQYPTNVSVPATTLSSPVSGGGIGWTPRKVVVMMGDWVPRIAAVLTLFVISLSAPLTARRWAQANLEKLLAVVDRLPESPAKSELIRQSCRHADRLAAMYRVRLPIYLVSVLLATVLYGIFAISYQLLSEHDRSYYLRNILTLIALAVVARSVYYLLRRIRDERRLFINKGCPSDFTYEMGLPPSSAMFSRVIRAARIRSWRLATHFPRRLREPPRGDRPPLDA